MAEKANKKPPKFEVPTRVPKKPGIFDNLGQNRGQGAHPLREILRAEDPESTVRTFPTEGSEPSLNEESTQRTHTTEGTTTDSTSGTIRTDTTQRTESTETTARTIPTVGITDSTEGNQAFTGPTVTAERTEPTVGTERAVRRSATIAPDRNYQKVSNQLTKVAIPDGYFKPGKSLELYMKLHELTRGAVVPKRKIRIPRKQLMRAAGIGSDKTLDSILHDFKIKGIIAETVFDGQHAGKEYEVFTPEEWPPLGTVGSQTTYGSPAQKLGYLPTVESTYGSPTPEPVNTGVSAPAKTLFKDFLKPDDEKAVFDALKKFCEAGKAVTGRELTRADWQAFGEIIDTLIDETTIAAARTNVSTYGKFAAENLRRRLYQNKNPRKPEPKLFEPGKFEEGREVEVEPIAPEPLGDRRELVLGSLRTFAKNNGREFIETFRSTHTEEDWNWLMENLEDGS